MFANYEWIVTDKYDAKNTEHKRIKASPPLPHILSPCWRDSSDYSLHWGHFNSCQTPPMHQMLKGAKVHVLLGLTLAICFYLYRKVSRSATASPPSLPRRR